MCWSLILTKQRPGKETRKERTNMKPTGQFLLMIIHLIGIIIFQVNYTMGVYLPYQRQIGYHWELADKSSTISDKSMHIDNFVKSLEDSGVPATKHNALFFTYPNNQFGENLKALKSLQNRLAEAKSMDPNSVAYQTAIQQVTSQEQGEAGEMISVFYDCWILHHHSIIFWNWVSLLTNTMLWFGLIYWGARIIGEWMD